MFAPLPPILSKGQPPSYLETRSVAALGSVALDQWRGLALMLVLLSHGFFFTNRVNGAGRIGVNLFFFISGILVFRSLHKQPHHAWNMAAAFWWRRLRRLYPALLAYVGIMLCAVIFLQRLPNQPAHSDLPSFLRAVPWALGYLINYATDEPMSLGHLWSLACEMQFYFLAPLIFLLGGRTATRRTLVFGLATLSLAAVGFIYPLRSPHYESAKYHFEIAVWPMMLGFFCEYGKLWFMQIPVRAVRTIFGFGISALIMALILMLFGMQMKKPAIALGAALLLPCFLGYLFGVPFPGKVGAFLAWIGERTYSIYLWQQPLTLCNFLPPVLHPAGASLSILVGAAWFRLFEKPFLSANRSQPLKTFVVSGKQADARET
jgi:peptidoglycan/LPS O-acetylase OafA/YrhL